MTFAALFVSEKRDKHKAFLIYYNIKVKTKFQSTSKIKNQIPPVSATPTNALRALVNSLTTKNETIALLHGPSHPRGFPQKANRQGLLSVLFIYPSALFLKKIPFVFALYSFAMMCNISSSAEENAAIVHAVKQSTV